MFSQIVKRLNGTYSFHFTIEREAIKAVFLISDLFQPHEVAPMDLMDELGFDLENQKRLKPAVSGRGTEINQCEYYWRFNPEELQGEDKELYDKLIVAPNSIRRKILLNLK